MNEPKRIDPVHDKLLGGVLPVLQTPFHPDESIDFDTMQRQVEWLFERGADGVVVAMVSEVLRLSSDERRELAERVCRMAEGHGPVVISVGAESTYTAVEYTRHAESCGASAVMAIPPIATAALNSQIVDYYCRIIEATARPVIIQDASGYVGQTIPVATQAALAERYGMERVFYKPEALPLGPILSELRDATGGAGRVFEGSGGIALVDSYRRGIVGTMPGAELIDGIVALWRALGDGDEARIYRLAMPIASLVAMQHGLDGFLAIEKHLLVRQGIFGDANRGVRGPVAFELDDETRGEVDRRFELVMQAVKAVKAVKG